MREREFGADVVRILAVCLVFWLHFYLRNGFYYTPVDNLAGFIAVAFRRVFMCCIPLFLILTGYLKCGKPWKWSGYCSILPILTSYMLISMVHLLYKILIKKEIKPVSEWIQDFLGFRLANYGWYIGMYIGLFLLCPLMVRLWQKQKRACRNDIVPGDGDIPSVYGECLCAGFGYEHSADIFYQYVLYYLFPDWLLYTNLSSEGKSKDCSSGYFPAGNAAVWYEPAHEGRGRQLLFRVQF